MTGSQVVSKATALSHKCPAGVQHAAAFGLLLERFTKPAGCAFFTAQYQTIAAGSWRFLALGRPRLAGHQADVCLPCSAHAEATCFLPLWRQTNKAQSAGCCRQCLSCTREAAKRRFLARCECASFVFSVLFELSHAGRNLCHRS